MLACTIKCTLCSNKYIHTYVPGVENTLADRESRTQNLDAEWKLKPKWFKYSLVNLT